MKIPNPKEKLITCSAVILVIAIMYFLDLPSFFQYIFRIDCPGCGMTRAYISLLHGDVITAFSFHPMFWSVPLCLLLYLYDGVLFKKQWLNTCLIVALILGFLANWICKLL